VEDVDEPRLSVSGAARRLGIAPGTLRTWDRRYGIGPTGHTRGRHRLYSAADMARRSFSRPSPGLSDRGPDPNVVKHRVVANATWEVPVGHGRSHGTNMSGWANALFGGWTVSSLFQARTGNNLTPFFSSYYTTSPWNTGKPLDGLGNFFCCAWRPDQVADPGEGASREAFFNQAAYALPAPGQLGNAGKGSLRGPGTWVVNFAFYKNIVERPRLKVQLTALLDNAFNHPQFFVPYGDGFAQLDSFLIDGDPNNGSTAVLGEGAIQNVEGFATGRQFRLGIRASF